jgi:hypothetical protein
MEGGIRDVHARKRIEDDMDSLYYNTTVRLKLIQGNITP